MELLKMTRSSLIIGQLRTFTDKKTAEVITRKSYDAYLFTSEKTLFDVKG